VVYIYNSPLEQRQYFEKIQAVLKPSATLPEDFDPSVYAQLNPDIDVTNIHPTVHFERCGYLEKRPYKFCNIPIDFDPSVYSQLNPDITNIDPTVHFERYGYLEKRQYKCCNELETLIKK
jgi:hypothetical protein